MEQESNQKNLVLFLENARMHPISHSSSPTVHGPAEVGDTQEAAVPYQYRRPIEIVNSRAQLTTTDV